VTQPRKEQVKNLKTKYTRFTGVGTLSIGGGPVQTVLNSVLEAFYDNFLSVTKTGIVGGAETSAPAVLYGGSGPFALSAGNSFTLSVAGLNGGTAFPVVVQAGDVVTLGGSPVVTTARMADRINQVTSGFGATAPVAANVSGRLVLTSATASGVSLGDSAIMTVTEVTSGILGVLGFSLVSSATAVGTTAPKRGVVTVSSDGLGGTVQLRKLDTSISEALNSVMRHTLAGVYVPETLHGQPTYARLTAFPGPVINGRNLKFSFYRAGPVRPRVVTSSGAAKSNFSTLTGADSVAVNLVFGNGQTLNFNVTFPSVSTVQNVVDTFNSAFSTASLAATSGQTNSAFPQVISKLAGPYRFTDQANKDSFFFSFNGLTPIHFNPAPGIYSAEQMAGLIGTAIGIAGQGGEGQAFVYTSPSGSTHVGIQSLNSDVIASSLRLLPGNPGGAVPGTFMETLDEFGLVPGVYKAGTVAELYGLDEVEIHCPSPLPGAQLTITGSSGTMTKLGLPASVSASTTNGVQAVVAPTSHALIPEMVEFHEERDDYDSVVQDFDNRSPFNQLVPQDGTANVGLDQIIGSDGKVNAQLLPRILGFLGLDQMNVGAKLGSLLSSTLTPKIQASHEWSETGFYNLLFESSADISGAGSPNVNTVIRVYTFSGSVFVTLNGKMVQTPGNPNCFTRDTATDSFLLDFTQGVLKLSFHRDTDPSTWGLTDWKNSVTMDPEGQGPNEDVVRIGEGLISNSAESAKARVGTPIFSDQRILLYNGYHGGGAGTSGNLRIYCNIANATDQSFLEITVNASFVSGQWYKDDESSRSSRYTFGQDFFEIDTKAGGESVSPWSDTDWDSTPFYSEFANGGASLAGQLILGTEMGNVPNVPRAVAYRANPQIDRRTLLFESPAGGPYATIPIRLYMDSGTALLGDGFSFTYNARWDQGLDKWIQDVPTSPSYAWSMNNPRFLFLRKAAGSGNWADSYGNWDSYDGFDRNPGFEGAVVKNGFYRVDQTAANIAAATAPVPNATYAKNMIKSWGKVKGDGPSTFNVSLMDGFNCNFTGYDGGAGAYANSFATSMGNTNYAVLFSGRASNYPYPSPPVEPGSYYVWTGTKLSLYSAALIGQATYGYSYYPLTAQNGKPDFFLGDIRGYFMYFVVVGAQ
jgi:hypothetical protein